MSISIQNNNINVTNSSGETIFDTGTPMPHIAQVVTNTITHTFPDTTDSTASTYGAGISCTYFENVCNFEYVCNYETVCGYQYVCNYDYFNGFSCGFQYVCNFEYVCNWETVCAYDFVTVFNGNSVNSSNVVDAKEHESTYDIATLDANLNADFLLVEANFNRTTAGSQQDYGTFVATVATNQNVVANGSSVVETVFEPSGSPWLNRIVSVYIDGNKVKAQFKHSNKSYTSNIYNYATCCPAFSDFYFCTPVASTSADNIESTWEVAFKVYVGKFTV